MTLTKEFIPLTQTTSMRQHSDRIILQVKTVESKCKRMLKAPKAKRGRKKSNFNCFIKMVGNESKAGKQLEKEKMLERITE